MLDLAAHIVQTKSGHFDPAQFADRYENALIDLLKKKEAGEKIEPAKEGPSTQARRPAKKRARSEPFPSA
jgi:non-homologous end joining protein Ku